MSPLWGSEEIKRAVAYKHFTPNGAMKRALLGFLLICVIPRSSAAKNL